LVPTERDIVLGFVERAAKAQKRAAFDSLRIRRGAVAR